MFHADQMQADGRVTNSTAPSKEKVEQPIDTNSDEEAVHFAFSDLAVGGRCKCNGHANRCVRDKITEKNPTGAETVKWGPLRCDCQHNTVGADCERCAPGYLDRPWARATNEDANVCKGASFHSLILSL